ncbi:hypothetical protein VDGL01_02440 [Verticillium dahliae]
MRLVHLGDHSHLTRQSNNQRDLDKDWAWLNLIPVRESLTCGCGHGPFEGAHSAALEFAAARDFLGYTHLQRPSVADAKPQGLKYLTRRDAIGLPRLSRTILPM